MKDNYIQNETSVARCIPIGVQHATTAPNPCNETCNEHATTSLKALALQGLAHNKTCNEHATDTEKPCNEIGHSCCMVATAVTQQPYTLDELLTWYQSNRLTLNPSEDLFGYRNSKVSEPVELVDLILKEKPDYWMRTNGDLEHCLQIIRRHAQVRGL